MTDPSTYILSDNFANCYFILAVTRLSISSSIRIRGNSSPTFLFMLSIHESFDAASSYLKNDSLTYIRHFLSLAKNSASFSLVAIFDFVPDEHSVFVQEVQRLLVCIENPIVRI